MLHVLAQLSGATAYAAFLGCVIAAAFAIGSLDGEPAVRLARLLALIGGSAVLVALVLAARAPAVAATLPAVIPPISGPISPGIVTVGDATVKIKPNLAIITVGVTVQAATAADAQAQAADRIARVLNAAKALGIADKDTKSGGYSIQPQYAYDRGNAPKITAYQATQQIVLSYRKVDEAGKALDALVQNDGATNASVQFALEDPKTAQADARAKAIADARAKAQAMADAAGVKVGTVISVSDLSSSVGPYQAYDAVKGMPAPMPGAQTQIPVADLDIVIHVTVQFSIG
jgi:uncharacterized protein YggE